MWAFWFLFCLSFVMASYANKINRIQVKHGFQLNFKLPIEVESLEFSSADNSKQYIIWSSSGNPKRGQVKGLGNDRRFIINSATFDDEGNYKQRNAWKNVVAMVTVMVVPSVLEVERVAGETLDIPLKGLRSTQATLNFRSQDLNLTLVDHGLPIGNNHPDYYERLEVTADAIKVLHVNVSDVGNYTLKDHRGRKVLFVNMKLVDKHKSVSPLVGLMLLLGIPGGVCWCCRKRIFKKRGQSMTRANLQNETLVPPPGPPPSYNTVVVPAVPGPIIAPAYPAPGESKVHPPPGPAFAPQPYYGGQPAMPANPGIISGYSQENPAYPVAPGFPPAQPSQWSAASYSPHAPAPMINACAYPAPGESKVHPPPSSAFAPQPVYGVQPAMPPNPGLAPVMFHAPAGPASVTGEINMNEISHATPLLTPSQPEVRQGSNTDADFLNSHPDVQFNINTGKDAASNFL